MKAKDRFEEIKIKMMMKLEKLGHRPKTRSSASCDVRQGGLSGGRVAEEDVLMLKELIGED